MASFKLSPTFFNQLQFLSLPNLPANFLYQPVDQSSQPPSPRIPFPLPPFKRHNRSFQAVSAVSGLILTWLLVHAFSGATSSIAPSKIEVPAANDTTPFLLAPAHQASHDYSIKPIVYIFPQYYPFPENDRIWGPNFTEWNNVKRVTKNWHGLETIRPHESIGYYNGLEYETRVRHGKFIRDNDFYGLCFHHYWMSGVPIMDHILQAMLIDGEPNVPFMMSWANEPWTATWDGTDTSKVLIAQDYGSIPEWRKHFDWLLPFFRHPNYIRSNGKVQFIVYKSLHMERQRPNLRYQMYNAFRQWATEEGLGGMEIIESRWGNSPSFANADAVNEFQPHAGGMNTEDVHLANRLAATYHRGTMVCWDATPRHVKDGGGAPWPDCHPTSWMWNIVKLMGKIKQDPNPPGVENFLFINALNEWGEGNCLEPSVQFGFRYGEAFKEAVRISEEKHLWQSQEIEAGAERIQSFRASTKINRTDTVPVPDVCVLIRTTASNAPNSPFSLQATISSLQSQYNRNWRAVVYSLDLGNIYTDVDTSFEPRLVEVRLKNATDAATATDKILSNLTNTNPLCASARYMLITDAGNQYTPTAFDFAATGETDFVALNVESRYTILDDTEMFEGHLCTRLLEPSRKLFRPSTPHPGQFDLSATFISLPKYFSSLDSGMMTPPAVNFSLSAHQASNISLPAVVNNTWYQEGGTLAQVLVETKGWSWTAPTQMDYQHVLHNPSVTGCREAGMIWVDSVKFGEAGCYNTPDLGHLYDGWKNVDLEFYRRHGTCIKKN